MPADEEDLPGTLKRSPAKAQRTYEKALDSAHEEYDEKEQADRTALASVKHCFEKVGDHWEPKDHRRHSDARQGGPRNWRPTAGGVDVEATPKQEPRPGQGARCIEGRSRMSKVELGQAIARKQD